MYLLIIFLYLRALSYTISRFMVAMCCTLYYSYIKGKYRGKCVAWKKSYHSNKLQELYLLRSSIILISILHKRFILQTYISTLEMVNVDILSPSIKGNIYLFRSVAMHTCLHTSGKRAVTAKQHRFFLFCSFHFEISILLQKWIGLVHIRKMVIFFLLDKYN